MDGVPGMAMQPGPSVTTPRPPVVTPKRVLSVGTRATTAVNLNKYSLSGRKAVLKPAHVMPNAELIGDGRYRQKKITYTERSKVHDSDEEDEEDGFQARRKKLTMAHIVQLMRVKTPPLMHRGRMESVVEDPDEAPEFYTLADTEQLRIKKEELALADFPEGKPRKWKDPLFFRLKTWYIRAHRAVDDDDDDEDESIIDQLVADTMYALSHTSVVESLSFAEVPLVSHGHQHENHDAEFDPTMFGRVYCLCYRGLGETPSRVTTLALPFCKLNNGACIVLAEWLKTGAMPCLFTLDLSHNFVGSIGLQAVAIAIRHPSNYIESLNLHGNPLGDDSIDAVVDLLTCKDLQWLDLGFCQLTNGIGRELFAAVGLTSLQYLSLEGMRINSQTSLLLLSAVTQNKTLTELNLKFNAACSQNPYVERLEAMFRRNRLLHEEREKHGRRASHVSMSKFDRRASSSSNSSSADEAQALRNGYHKYTTNEPTNAPWRPDNRVPMLGGGAGIGAKSSTTTNTTSLPVIRSAR